MFVTLELGLSKPLLQLDIKVPFVVLGILIVKWKKGH